VTGNITQLLLKWSDGDQTALDQLMPLVYDELRQLARSYLRRRGAQHSMQPTVLVNEAYLRLVNQRQVNWQCRAQFFGLAAKLMRNLLVDYVRERRAAKRGGGQYNLSLNYADQTTQQDISICSMRARPPKARSGTLCSSRLLQSIMAQRRHRPISRCKPAGTF